LIKRFLGFAKKIEKNFSGEKNEISKRKHPKPYEESSAKPFL